jgi:hypothetical protein
MRSGNLSPWDTSGGRGIFVLLFDVRKEREKSKSFLRREKI